MPFIKRDLLPLLQSHRPPKACVLFGPRRTGKTTLLRELSRQQNVSWFNGDNSLEVAQNLDLPTGAAIRSLLMNSKTIVIDEAQRIPGIGLLLKRLVDENEQLENPVNIFATGSSAFELAAGVKESALGRLREYNVWPLSMAELAADSSWVNALLNIDTRIVYGMYPEICTDPEYARDNLISHCQSLLFKDLFNLSSIRYSSKFETLVKVLAYNIGSVVNYDNLSRETGLSRPTVMEYIRLLEQCFVVKVCHSYAKNLSNELKKSKKIYFCDTGIRNAVIEDFSPLASRADAGALWENFFFMERVKFHSLRRDYARIYFWRTSGRQPREIDFVEVIDNKMRAFECKLSEKAKSRSHEIFTKAYPDCTVDVVSPQDLMRVWQV